MKNLQKLSFNWEFLHFIAIWLSVLFILTAPVIYASLYGLDQPPEGLLLLPFVPSIFTMFLLGPLKQNWWVFAFFFSASFFILLASWINQIRLYKMQVFGRGIFWWFNIGLIGLCSFILMPYHPISKPKFGVEMHIVNVKSFIDRVVLSAKAGAELRDCAYEPLGWLNNTELVYRAWCKGQFINGMWDTGTPNPPQLYSVLSKQSSYFDDSLNSITRNPCKFEICVDHLIEGRKWSDGYIQKKGFPTPYPDSFREVLPSPDQQWVAFTSAHLYGPDNLLIVRTNNPP